MHHQRIKQESIYDRITRIFDSQNLIKVNLSKMLKKFIINNKIVSKINGNKRCFADLWEKSKNLCDTRITI